MDLEYDDLQRMLRDSVRRFVARTCPTPRVRAIEASADGFDRELWASMADLGWPGLALPERYGGGGQGLLELAVVAEQLGYGGVPSPLAASTTLVALPLVWAGSDALRDRWLPGLAEGSVVGAPALVPPGGRAEHAAAAFRVDETGRVTGRAVLVPYAGAASVLLASVTLPGDDRGLALLTVDAAARAAVRRHSALTGDALFEVTADRVAPPADVLARGRDADTLLQRGLDAAAVVGAAYAVGAAERCLDLALEHAKSRHQFGRPIGSFQAVAHRCVDMRADIDACRYLTYQAAWALDQPPEVDLPTDAVTAVSATKAFTSDALRRVQRNAHQVHGAMGFTLEHDLHLFTRRLKAYELSFGAAATHRERVATSLGLSD